MKKYMIALAIFILFATTSFALTFTRDIIDHVEIEKAIKAEFCEIENPGCDEPIGGGVPVDLAADCLRKKMAELDCLPRTKEIIYGEMRIFEKKEGVEGGVFGAADTIIMVDENIYDGSGGSLGYYYINDDPYQGVDTSVGGYYAYRADSNEKFGGVKYAALNLIRRLDSDIPPYGYEWVKPGYILAYYDRDRFLHMYIDLNGTYYKMSSIKKEVENKTWTPPPELGTQNEVEIPKKTEIETPIPPPPIYLPGMPETADPQKEHVIPNCNSQGASVCREDEECPDKWIKAKEDRCCSVVCTPVGKKEVPPGLEKKNETEKNKTKEENITNNTCSECQEPSGWSACIDGQQKRVVYYCNETTDYICESYLETQVCIMQNNTFNPSTACVDAGGTVKPLLCCNSVNDFPNTCLIGACGCSLENSHEVKACDCGEGKCWNGNTCE